MSVQAGLSGRKRCARWKLRGTGTGFHQPSTKFQKRKRHIISASIPKKMLLAWMDIIVNLVIYGDSWPAGVFGHLPDLLRSPCLATRSCRGPTGQLGVPRFYSAPCPSPVLLSADHTQVFCLLLLVRSARLQKFAIVVFLEQVNPMGK